MSRLRSALKVAIVALVGATLVAGFSRTGGTPRMARASVSSSSATAVAIDAGDLSPGGGGTAFVAIDTGSQTSAALAIHAIDVVNRETGCSANERDVDATCGAGPGELSADVVLSVWLPDGGHPAWSGTVDDLRAGATLSDVPSGRWDLRVDYLLTAASSNNTQTDGLQWTLAFDAPEATVLGVEIQRDPLARTGLDAVRLVLWAAALLGLGAAVLLSCRVGMPSEPHRGRGGMSAHIQS